MSRRCAFRIALAVCVATNLASLPLRADEADERHDIAAGHYAQKRWDLAAETFESFLKDYPDHPKSNQALFFLAEALLQLAKYQEAQTRFGEYLTKSPEGPYALSAQFRAAESAHVAGNSKEAKALLQAFGKRYPEERLNGYVLSYLGDIFLAEGNAEQAETCFRRALSQFPQTNTQDRCRFGLARALETQGKQQEAERLFLAVAGKTGSPLADDAQFRLGALQYAAGRFDEALETFNAFETRLRDSRWCPTVRLGRGWALVKLNRLEEAKESFQSITSDSKIGMQARYWLGLTHKAQEDWQAAAATLMEAAAAAPGHHLVTAIRVHAGHALLRTGDPSGAGEQFQLALNQSARDEAWADDAMHGLAQAATTARDHDAVDRVAAQFVSRFPESPLREDVERMQAQSFIARRLFARAIEILEALAAGEQDQIDRLENQYLLALAYEGVERWDDALAVLQPVLEEKGTDFHADAQLAQASLLMATKRYDQAIEPLKAVLVASAAGDSTARALGHLAISLARTDRLDQAKPVYERLTREYPGHELVVAVTEQLAEAALDGGDASWSAELFQWLGTNSGAARYRLSGLTGLAWSHYRSGRLEEAAEAFGQVLKQNPDAARASESSLARGQILQQLGRHDEALDLYDMVIQRFSHTEQHREALLSAARLRDHLGQDEQAAALYQQLADEYPDAPGIDSALYEWAWTLRDLHRADQADAIFRRIHEEHPESDDWAEATYRVAEHAYGRGDFVTAGEMVRGVLDKEPDDRIQQGSLFLQGKIASAEGKWSEARQAFGSLVERYPEGDMRLQAEYGIAEATARENDHKAAIPLFQKLVESTRGRKEPWVALFHLRLAQSLAEEEKWTEAYQIASKIEQTFPEFEEQYEADYIIGRCLFAKADIEGARTFYRKAHRSPNGQKTETAATARFLVAESYWHQKDYEQALREYLAVEILYDYPDLQAAALLQSGKCYQKLGEWSKAVEQYARVLKLYGDTQYAQEASRLLPAARQRAEDRLAG